MSTNATPARERDDHADCDPAAEPALGNSGSFSDEFAVELLKRAKTPRSENIDHDVVVARVMANIRSFGK